MDAEIPADRVDAWLRLLRTQTALVEHLDGELRAELGLSLKRYDVLMQLRTAPRGLRLNQLADAVVLSRSGLSHLIDRMEADGLIERRESPEDGRGAVAVMTPAGRRLVNRARRLHHESVHRLFTAHLSDGDVAALKRIFGRVAAALPR